MKVVIMAGGLGTRLRPLTFSIPKPLLPVGEKPILEIILSKLKKHGLTDIILSVGYKSELIKTYFGDGSKFGVKIDYFDEEKRLGTAGSLNMIKKEYNLNEPFLVMNGDILTKLDFKKMITYHLNKKACMTVGIKNHKMQSPFGVIHLNGDAIEEIKEKPILRFNISAGIYILDPEVVDLIPQNEYFDMPMLIKSCIDKSKNISAYSIKEYWLGLENLKSFNKASSQKEEWKG
ncbi:MAG: NTP transferase domain-containing protein [Nanoarchaeota archaeon]|nr:NTP transferase domain-containing protein [Nanoarchaeota archaeon]